jgi:Rrf2 family protein
VSISAKTQYACIALLELAVHYPAGQPVRARSIADKHGIPSQFLLQILAQLKAAGLVVGTRGASGGYRLSREPGEITLGQIVGCIEGQNDELPTTGDHDTWAGQVLAGVWRQVDLAQREILDSLTIAELARDVPESAEHMYYI